MKELSFLAGLALATASCDARVAAAENTNAHRVSPDARRQVEAIKVPQLEFCVLNEGSVPPSKLGGSSPPCSSKYSFTPTGIRPERINGNFGVILILTARDKEQLSAVGGASVRRSAVLLRCGVVVSNFLILGNRMTDFHIAFDDKGESDIFFHALFGKRQCGNRDR